MTNPASISLHGPTKTILRRMLDVIPDDAVHAIQVENFIRELWTLARRPKVFLNPLAVFSIAVHETDYFRSDLWRDNLNPGGLKNAEATGYQTFINGTDAARALCVHVLMYTDGKAGNLGKYRVLDERASAVTKAGYAGTVKTLADMHNKWATDSAWPEKVTARYDQIRLFNLENDTPEQKYIEDRTRVVPTGRVNTPNLKLDADHIIVHQTGNPGYGAGAYMHNGFLWAGGGGENVSFHWVVDDTYVVQNVDTNYVTWQAGDGYYGRGNRRGESYELCINADSDYTQTLHNAAHHIARRLRARGWQPDTTRLRPGQHRNFSGKWCPAQLLNNVDGISWPEFVNLIREYYNNV